MGNDTQDKKNIDRLVVEDFGREWRAFNQSEIADEALLRAFNQYFDIFPFEKISQNSIGFDMGCGSGRWAKLIAPRVGRLNCIDPSEMALAEAKNKLRDFQNCHFECAPVGDVALPQGSQDFGYCLGVLHHTPDTLAGIKSCVEKLKPGAPFLLYLYYRFDNKPVWYRLIWSLSDILWRIVSVMPFRLKFLVCQVIAHAIYWPLSRAALISEKLGFNVDNFPLSDYRTKPVYFLKTDALDRFGTRLEKRFTRAEITQMLHQAKLVDIKFSNSAPFWVAVGIKEPLSESPTGGGTAGVN